MRPWEAKICMVNKHHHPWNAEAHKWEKIFTNYSSNRELVSKINKEL